MSTSHYPQVKPFSPHRRLQAITFSLAQSPYRPCGLGRHARNVIGSSDVKHEVQRRLHGLSVILDMRERHRLSLPCFTRDPWESGREGLSDSRYSCGR